MEKLFTNEWKKSSHVYLTLNIVPLADKVPIEKQNKTNPNLIILKVNENVTRVTLSLVVGIFLQKIRYIYF